MRLMSNDPLELNYIALCAAIMSDHSVQKVLSKLGLCEQVQQPDTAAREQRDREIRRRFAAGQKAYDIAREMGVHRQTVYNATAGAGRNEKGGAVSGK